MLELGNEQAFSAAAAYAALLALWAALPVLLLGYTRRSLSIRRLRANFSLRKTESTELDRAVLHYDKVRRRIEEIHNQSAGPRSLWRTIFGYYPDFDENQADELEDLRAHAHHLRATIVRLRRQPLQRLRSWVHVLSSHFALGGALATYIVGLGLLIVAFQNLWADQLGGVPAGPVVWLDARLFYANAVAAGFAAAAAPVFYLVRWVCLRHERLLEFWAFKEFADRDLEMQADAAHADASWRQRGEVAHADNWFAILGISQSATIEQIKDAYKALIKQTHPDRVQGMSPIFRKLAEAETKKLNAAYRHALLAVPLAAEREAAA
jgi:DnaJ domain